MLALAVLFCLVLPMAGGGATQIAMACCFVLAVLFGLGIVLRPVRLAANIVGLTPSLTRTEAVLPFARAPNPVTLGILLN